MQCWTLYDICTSVQLRHVCMDTIKHREKHKLPMNMYKFILKTVDIMYDIGSKPTIFGCVKSNVLTSKLHWR